MNILRVPAVPALLLASLTLAQEPEPPAPKPELPKLPSAEAAKVRAWIRRLDTEDEEAIAELEHKLTALGAGIARELVRELESRDREIRALAERVLDRVLEPEHAPALLPLLDDRDVHTRRYASLRIARFHAKEAEEPFRAVLAAKDVDDEVAFHAWLGLAGLGDLGALEPVFARCLEEWRDVGAVVSEVLEPVRGPEALRWLTERMRGSDEQTKITCLRLMRSLCPKDHAGVIALYLDVEQHAVKKEAINALRVVVDGDPPIENLSVFQGIAMAKKWKERL